MPNWEWQKSYLIVRRFHTAFCFLFAMIFSWLFLGILFENKIYSFKTLAVIFVMTGWMLLTAYFFRWVNRREALLIRWEKQFLATWLLLLFSLQLYLGYLLAVETSWDTEAVYKGAVNLAVQGNLGNYHDYFHIFPHNLGAAYILSLFFSAGSALGVENYYWLGTLYNVVSLSVGNLLIYLIVRELKGAKAAFLALWLSSICIPLHFYTPIFYTDTLSLPFVAGLYYLYLRFLKPQSLRGRLLLAVAFGLVCALGSLIKFTVALVAVAVCVDMFFRKAMWRHWYLVMLAGLIFVGSIKGFDSYRYGKVLDKSFSDQKRVPYTHWVMMGLAGNGSYNGEDYDYTYTYPTQEQRIQANWVRIKQRLSDYGLWGYLEFINRKQQLNFGSGIYAVNEMIDDNPVRRNDLHEFALDGGKYFEYFKSIAQGYHVFLFVLIICSSLYDAVTKNPRAMGIFAARIAIMGIYFFLMLWEASARYIINFLPIFIVCAAYGFADVYRVFVALRRTLLDVLRPPETQEGSAV